jgi:hypothetical protein
MLLQRRGPIPLQTDSKRGRCKSSPAGIGVFEGVQESATRHGFAGDGSPESRSPSPPGEPNGHRSSSVPGPDSGFTLPDPAEFEPMPLPREEVVRRVTTFISKQRGRHYTGVFVGTEAELARACLMSNATISDLVRETVLEVHHGEGATAITAGSVGERTMGEVWLQVRVTAAGVADDTMPTREDETAALLRRAQEVLRAASPG